MTGYRRDWSAGTRTRSSVMLVRVGPGHPGAVHGARPALDEGRGMYFVTAAVMFMND